MKKFALYILTAVMAAIMTVCTLHVISVEATEFTGIAAVVAKAKSIQNGEWDSSLGPYEEPNGQRNYRYLLVRGEGSDVTFELLKIEGGIASLGDALAKALG